MAKPPTTPAPNPPTVEDLTEALAIANAAAILWEGKFVALAEETFTLVTEIRTRHLTTPGVRQALNTFLLSRLVPAVPVDRRDALEREVAAR